MVMLMLMTGQALESVLRQVLRSRQALREQPGRRVEAVRFSERVVQLQKAIHGVRSQVFEEAVCELAEEYNEVAALCVRQGDIPTAQRLLAQADALTEPGRYLPAEHAQRVRSRASTFNSLSAIFRKKGLHSKSLALAERALKLHTHLLQSGVPVDPSATYLNMCGALSQEHRHREALRFAEFALEELQEGDRAEGEQQQQQQKESPLLPIAWHNKGVEHEYMRQIALALEAYGRGLEVAQRVLGEESPTTVLLKQALEGAEENQRLRQERRQQKKKNRPWTEKVPVSPSQTRLSPGRRRQRKHPYLDMERLPSSREGGARNSGPSEVERLLAEVSSARGSGRLELPDLGSPSTSSASPAPEVTGWRARLPEGHPSRLSRSLSPAARRNARGGAAAAAAGSSRSPAMRRAGPPVSRGVVRPPDAKEEEGEEGERWTKGTDTLPPLT